MRASLRSQKDLEKAQRRLNTLRPLEPVIATYHRLPQKLVAMREAMARLPPVDPSPTFLRPYTNEGKREWETSKTGYENWAVQRLVAKAGEGVAGAEVDQLVTNAQETGEAEILRAAVRATERVRDALSNTAMDTD